MDSSSPSIKKITDSDLKSSIIEFMRDRPFLWNNKHPDYKDHKRREQEFSQFSNNINCSVREIKRIWHVLRTNFFRAHKLLLERPQTRGDNIGLWKYYLSMQYILEGNSIDTTTLVIKKNSKSSIKPDQRAIETARDCSGSCSSNYTVSNTNIKKSQRPDFLQLALDDEDLLYSRSLTSTLRRFDPKTKEIIKLRFQEIIVSYMQQKDVFVQQR